MEITTEQEQRLLQATEEFRKAMALRSNMSVRVAKRVTAILRIGMVSFGVLALILLMMLYAFTSKMDEMIAALSTMNGQFSSMSKDMAKIRTTIHQMERNIAYVPAITQATGNIQLTVAGMRSEIDSMSATMTQLNKDMGSITGEMTNITWQMRSIDPAVQYMGHDVNRISGPMRLFNKLNPFE